ncbi:response regulator [Streptomyces sp. NPDC005533]|uniref:response regulator n=1 Tax=Streptomyces sp. NPDC005533 TaxID=3364723 RepID=UPI00367904F5
MNKDLKILIIGDSPTGRRTTKSLLRDAGYSNTEEADGGATALPILERGRYDFVITDLNKPSMSIDLLQKVRAHDQLGALPFLMTVAEVKREQLVPVEQADANHFITKPLTASDLKAKIEKIFTKVESADPAETCLVEG